MTLQHAVQRPNHVARGAALIVFAVFLMAFQDAVIKYASADLPLWQIYVLRSAMALPALAGIAALAGRPAGTLARGLAPWPLIRAAALVAMYVSMYAALPVLHLSTLAAGLYVGPLFITLLSALTIGERVSPRGWLGVSIGFCGVILILRPGSDAFSPFVLLAVLSGFFYAVAAILTRSKCQDDGPVALAVSLNMALLAMGIVASLAIFAWNPAPAEVAVYPFLLSPWVGMDAADWTLVATLAALILGIGVGLAAAYQSAPPVVVATFDYSYLIFASVFGYLVFAEVPDWQTVAGMATIAGAGLVVVRG